MPPLYRPHGAPTFRHSRSPLPLLTYSVACSQLCADRQETGPEPFSRTPTRASASLVTRLRLVSLLPSPRQEYVVDRNVDFVYLQSHQVFDPSYDVRSHAL